MPDLNGSWVTRDFLLSLTVDGQLGEDGYTSVMAGLSLYFGGEDKSLIRRHREDDPRLRFFNIFNAGVLEQWRVG